MRIMNHIATDQGYLRKATFISACLVVALFLYPFAVQAQEYEIGEGDLLRITVYDNSDLSTEARVSGEGKITLPLIGELSVSGLTATEIGKKAAQLYADGYIKNPQVNVFILEYKSKKVTALGEFMKPGLIEMRGVSTLMEVISNAGGVTANAGDTLFIQRKLVKGAADHKNEIMIPVDLKKLLEKGDAASNMPVQDGDSIYVPRAAFVYVTGEVKTPGPVKKMRSNSTLMEIISSAGGITPDAGDKLFIQRSSGKGGTDGKDDIMITVDLKKLLEGDNVASNAPIQDGDSIYIPRAAFVYVTGEVKNPGAYKITQGLTVLRSVTLAGGFTQKASKDKTKIIRKTEKGEQTINIKMEDLVIPDDIISVPESFF
jgi:polysaccharide biosynthesis/export protein